VGATGVLICGHGSRDAEGCREFAALVGRLRAELREWPVELAYLEFARPILREGLEALRSRGVERVLAVPGMLFAAGHVKNDIPSVLHRYAREHGLEIRMGRELGIDPLLLEAARDRIAEALAASRRRLGLGDTLLLVVGRGTSDSDANGNVAKVMRMLWEGMGFAHGEVAYSGVAHPRTDAALARAVRLGLPRIVVFPYFLFTGVLVRRIYAAADAAAARHPEVEILKAPYLNDHPHVIRVFAERARGILADDVNMNCLLCKYRVRILGHEDDHGAPQQSHHHHVEGIGTDPEPHHHHHHHHHHGHAAPVHSPATDGRRAGSG